MGCNCEKANGFQEKLGLAKRETKKTGETHVVYVHKATNTVFMRKESDLNNDLKICCYFLPDGTEVEWTDKKAKELKKEADKKAKEAAKNATNDIEVAEEVVSPEEEN